MAGARKVVITGGPGAGKSTLLDELARRGERVEPEVARAILQGQGGMALRADDPHGFAHAMLDAELASWQRAHSSGGLTIFDRGFPDIAGFLAVEGLDIPEAIERICRDYRYDGPIFRAPPWRDIYRGDEERIQTWQEAVESDAAVSDAWRRFGYELIDLPLAPVEERVAFMLGLL
ncbi:AAA family ATPase [Erythrobacter sp. HKB08]|uniref:AAA family ATPase n=1 Tax=Erythrobacter sp. HKB08 TaxID=2502843 RepID=UPI001008FC5A|nr:AAA family ATPase [Erythrobacter sp. HKB08]